jgi:hypothetical protein
MSLGLQFCGDLTSNANRKAQKTPYAKERFSGDAGRANVAERNAIFGWTSEAPIHKDKDEEANRGDLPTLRALFFSRQR